MGVWEVARERMEWLDSLRGLAMLLVIVGHVRAVKASGPLVTVIYAFHMPLFFMISGATFRVGRYASLAECALDKARKLLVPYVLLYVVNLPLWYLANRVLYYHPVELSQLLVGFFTANHRIGTMSQAALWFLPTLFTVSVLYWWLADLARRGRLPLPASMSALLVVGILLSVFYRQQAVWHLTTVPIATVFYWLGHEFMRHRAGIVHWLGADGQPRKYAAWALVLLAVGVTAALANDKVSLHRNYYGNFALMFVAALSLSLAVTMVLMKLPTFAPLAYAGCNSLSFLGFHFPLVQYLERIPATAAFASAHGVLTGLIVFVLLFPLTALVNRFCPWLVGRGARPRARTAP